jgi:hypothetical protein
MDLFAVVPPNSYKDPKNPPPATGSAEANRLAAIYSPHSTSVGGRVNVNSHVQPFGDMVRKGALTALFTGVADSTGGTNNVLSKAAAGEIASNIYTRTLSPIKNKNVGKVYGYPWTANPGPSDSNAFDTPGEICEIKGVADNGEMSEDQVREVVSLITNRGGVFAIYTIGQSLKQTPGGKLIVTGEQRKENIVERYLDNRGTPTTDDDIVRFRSVYARNLSP